MQYYEEPPSEDLEYAISLQDLQEFKDSGYDENFFDIRDAIARIEMKRANPHDYRFSRTVKNLTVYFKYSVDRLASLNFYSDLRIST